MSRFPGDQMITVGCIPPEDWPAVASEQAAWLDTQFERQIQRAVLLGAKLKEISHAAEDAAIRFATDEEKRKRAARRLPPRCD
jgi:hypothetical protein